MRFWPTLQKCVAQAHAQMPQKWGEANMHLPLPADKTPELADSPAL
jgi:hypothetical protein